MRYIRVTLERFLGEYDIVLPLSEITKLLKDPTKDQVVITTRDGRQYSVNKSMDEILQSVKEL